MGIRERLRTLGPGPKRHRATGREHEPASIPIAETPLRRTTTLVGDVVDVRVVTRGGNPSLEVDVRDDTGMVVAVFTGRRDIPGIAPGRRLALVGVGRRDNERVVLLNPGYQLL